MHTLIRAFQQENLAAKGHIAPFKVGDTINVHVAIHEGNKERVQQFQGIVIAHKGQYGAPGSSCTVRKVASGVGVERTFPLSSPSVIKIDLVAMGSVRRSKLYYLRGTSGKAARVKQRFHARANTAAPADKNQQ